MVVSTSLLFFNISSGKGIFLMGDVHNDDDVNNDYAYWGL